MSPYERAAATKRRRTREKLIQAADMAIKCDGLDVRAEVVAQEAGVSVATFYNVFPSKGAMFVEVFRELVLANKPDHRAYAVVVADNQTKRGDQQPVLVRYFTDLHAAAAGRQSLIRGVLIARLENPPKVVTLTDWLEGQSGDDVVLELAYELCEMLISPVILQLEREGTYFALTNFMAVALFALDSYAVGPAPHGGRSPQELAAMAMKMLDEYMSD